MASILVLFDPLSRAEGSIDLLKRQVSDMNGASFSQLRIKANKYHTLRGGQDIRLFDAGIYTMTYDRYGCLQLNIQVGGNEKSYLFLKTSNHPGVRRVISFLGPQYGQSIKSINYHIDLDVGMIRVNTEDSFLVHSSSWLGISSTLSEQTIACEKQCYYPSLRPVFLQLDALFQKLAACEVGALDEIIEKKTLACLSECLRNYYTDEDKGKIQKELKAIPSRTTRAKLDKAIQFCGLPGEQKIKTITETVKLSLGVFQETVDLANDCFRSFKPSHQKEQQQQCFQNLVHRMHHTFSDISTQLGVV